MFKTLEISIRLFCLSVAQSLSRNIHISSLQLLKNDFVCIKDPNSLLLPSDSDL